MRGVFRKYDSGAVGSLTHAVCLQGANYSCELEVYADGYQLKFVLFHIQVPRKPQLS